MFQFYFLLLKYKNRQLTLIFASSAFPSSSCKLLFITVSVITEVRVLYFGPVCKSFEPETVRARFIINLIKRFGSLHKRRNDCAMKHLKNISFRDFLLKSKTCFYLQIQTQWGQFILTSPEGGEALFALTEFNS